MEIIKTHTGKIYVDRDRKLEFLTVGDYGKESNLKASFLGLHNKIQSVPHKEVDLSDKWVATISTQHGCPMNCAFCDCPKYGFYGNIGYSYLEHQIRQIIRGETVRKTERFNVHYARMGEPTFNEDVLLFTELGLREVVAQEGLEAVTIHPVVSTMLPNANKGKLKRYLHEWCRIKNEVYNGEAGLQFSINTTDEAVRAAQFDGKSLSLEEISELGKELPMPVGRKYTLNCAVTKDTILDADELTRLFDPNKFLVKLTPIHQTNAAVDNGFKLTTEYSDYDVYEKFETPLLAAGWDVIVFVPSVEEDTDRITCGNALISDKERMYDC